MPGGILALDHGSCTGWAHATPAALEAWQPPIPGRVGPLDGVTYGARRFDGHVASSYRSWLLKMSQDLRPMAVIYETPLPARAQKSQAAAEIAIQMAGMADDVCAELGIGCYSEWPARIKAHFCGTGRAKKADIMHACKLRGWTPARHDTADALALLDKAVWLLVTSRRRAA